jgi:hypothetical protein
VYVDGRPTVNLGGNNMPAAQPIDNLRRISDHPRYRVDRMLITRHALMNMWSVKSVNTIKSYVSKGMPEVRLPGGQPRYDVFECNRWLEGRREARR